jgi:hypothetical protein
VPAIACSLAIGTPGIKGARGSLFICTDYVPLWCKRQRRVAIFTIEYGSKDKWTTPRGQGHSRKAG